jgi:prepilin peptidase CpaA
MTSPDIGSTYLGFASICASIGAGLDIKSRRIPNNLTLSTFVLGVALHVALNGGRGLLSSLAGALICGTIFLVFYLAGGMGAGDVKLIAAVGAAVGLPHVTYLLVFTSLSGGAMAMAMAVMHGRLKETLFNVGALTAHHARQGFTPHQELNVTNKTTLRLPYGVAIACGTLLTFYIQITQG